jgi:hypothetical protein
MKADHSNATPSPTSDRRETIAVDTTGGSVIHRLLAPAGHGERDAVSAVTLFIVSGLVAYVPIVVTSWLGGIPLMHQTAAVRLPLFYDANTAWMCVASLPTLLILIVRDQRVLADALNQVQQDDVIRPYPGAAIELKNEYERKFRWLNIWSQVAALAIGIVVAAMNFHAMSDPTLGAWGAPGGVLRLPGYLLLVVVMVFYTLVGIYVARSAGIVVLLRGLVKKVDLEILPLHPDGCGGLRPMGQLGLRNQYALTVFGINVILLGYVAHAFLGNTGSMQLLVGLGVGAYLLVGPVVFLSPLLPFRGGMLDAKKRLLHPIAKRMREELANIEANIGAHGFTKEDEEVFDRLQKLGGVIALLPVWPFDARTIRKFVTAYVLPIVGALGAALLDALVKLRFHVLG